MTAGWIALTIAVWLALEIPGYVSGRLFYDDEFYEFFASRLSPIQLVQREVEVEPVSDVWTGGQTGLIHSFGHPLYVKGFFKVFGRSETVAFWSSLVPSAAALGLFLLIYLRLDGTHRLLAAALLVTNPMFLLYGSALRWYPLWAAIASAAMLVLTRRPEISVGDVTIGGLITAVLIIVQNSLAMVFAAGVIIWLLIQRRLKAAATFLVLIGAAALPWARTFLRYGTEGLGSPAWSRGVLSLGYVGFTLLAGETNSPLHIVTWLLILASLPVLLLHLPHAWRDRRQQLVIVLLGTALLVPPVTGLGFTKGHIFLFYSGLMTLFLMLAISRSIGDAGIRRVLGYGAFVAVLIMNVLAFAHLARGVYYHKQGLSDPIPQIVEQIRLWSNHGAMTVFTSNPVLAYYLSRLPEYPRALAVVTPYKDYLISTSASDFTSDGRRIVFVHSFLGSLDSAETHARYQTFRKRVAASFSDRVELSLKPDPEVWAKKMLFPQAHLEYYRFVLEVIPRVMPEDVRRLQTEYMKIW